MAEACDGFESVAMARELNVDAVLMDLYMPGLDGVSATRLIKRDLPDVQVVMLTVSEEEDDLFEAIQAGARGYIMKSVDSMCLIRQLTQVLAGGVAMNEDLTSRLVTGLARRIHRHRPPTENSGKSSVCSSRTCHRLPTLSAN